MPTAISIGPVSIHFYGVIIILGALAATWLSARRAVQYGQDPEAAWDMLPWALIGGVIGARLWHIFTPPASMVEMGYTTGYYLSHPLDALAVWNGGLGIPGAVIGGFIAVYIYSRRHDISILTWVDIIAPGLALAQGIGRWGNYVNQEVYGAPTELPWKLFIDQAHRLPGFQDVAYYHPLFLYEFIWNLLNAGFLIWVSRRYARRLKTGDLFLMYLVFYPVGRFFLEFLRLDPSPIAGININQTLMGTVAILSILALVYRHRPGHNELQPEIVPFVKKETAHNVPAPADPGKDGVSDSVEPAEDNQ